MYPYSRPNITEDDISAVADVLRGTMLTQGPKVEEFERAFGEAVGAPHVVSCNNGTSALHLAYAAAALGPDRALVTSPITFLATANAARFLDAPVYFADVDSATGLIDPVSVAKVVRNATKPIGAITAIHMGGRLCNLPALRKIADSAQAMLVEDACHAPGAVYRHQGETIGAGACRHSDLAAFSFHAIKHISMGEGGAVTAREPVLAKRMQLLRTHGLTRDPAEWTASPNDIGPWYYEMPEIGFNYRLPDILCTIGIGQVARLREGIARRYEIAGWYHSHLKGIGGLSLPELPDHPDENAWHLFPVKIDFAAIGRTRSDVMTALRERGVGTQVHYIPLYRQPPYSANARNGFGGAESYYGATLSIPMYPQLTEADIATISGHIRNVITG